MTSYEHLGASFVGADALGTFRRGPTSVLWSLCKKQDALHPKSGLHIETDDATYMQHSMKSSIIMSFLGRAGQASQGGLKIALKRKQTGSSVYCD